MSAASTATAQVRRTTAAPFSTPRGEDEIRLHLADIPRLEESMDVEGLKPTLLSRLFDLFVR
jgi:hypothetical protein